MGTYTPPAPRPIGDWQQRNSDFNCRCTRCEEARRDEQKQAVVRAIALFKKEPLCLI